MTYYLVYCNCIVKRLSASHGRNLRSRRSSSSSPPAAPAPVLPSSLSAPAPPPPPPVLNMAAAGAADGFMGNETTFPVYNPDVDLDGPEQYITRVKQYCGVQFPLSMNEQQAAKVVALMKNYLAASASRKLQEAEDTNVWPVPVATDIIYNWNGGVLPLPANHFHRNKLLQCFQLLRQEYGLSPFLKADRKRRILANAEVVARNAGYVMTPNQWLERLLKDLRSVDVVGAGLNTPEVINAFVSGLDPGTKSSLITRGILDPPAAGAQPLTLSAVAREAQKIYEQCIVAGIPTVLMHQAPPTAVNVALATQALQTVNGRGMGALDYRANTNYLFPTAGQVLKQPLPMDHANTISTIADVNRVFSFGPQLSTPNSLVSASNLLMPLESAARIQSIFPQTLSSAPSYSTLQALTQVPLSVDKACIPCGVMVKIPNATHCQKCGLPLTVATKEESNFLARLVQQAVVTPENELANSTFVKDILKGIKKRGKSVEIKMMEDDEESEESEEEEKAPSSHKRDHKKRASSPVPDHRNERIQRDLLQSIQHLSNSISNSQRPRVNNQYRGGNNNNNTNNRDYPRGNAGQPLPASNQRGNGYVRPNRPLLRCSMHGLGAHDDAGCWSQGAPKPSYITDKEQRGGGYNGGFNGQGRGMGNNNGNGGRNRE